MDEYATRPEKDDLQQERAGSRALSVFARVLNGGILTAHAEGPLSATELEANLGWASKASLRVATGNLHDLGALARLEGGDAQRGLATELTSAGGELLSVSGAVERWLAESPFGPIPLTDTAARGIIRALVAGWDSTIVRSLAEGPRSLAVLDAEITAYSYPALKRRLSKLRFANLATTVDVGRSPEHAATEWLQSAAGPISAATRWERNHGAGQVAPITRHEIEAMFLLALPLVELPQGSSGTCVFASPALQGLEDGPEPALAAVSLVVENGKVVSCSPGAASSPTTWALGTPDAWLDALVDGDRGGLRLRGDDVGIASALIDEIHGSLFDRDGTQIYTP